MTNPHRLPRHVLPENYQLRLEPDLQAATFDGYATISAAVTASTDTIVMNSIELEISSVTVTQNGQTLENSFVLDDELQRLTISCATALQPGLVEIAASFTGLLNDQLHGFYRSTFTGTDGEEHTIATTQFQSTDARRAFPCFDEPDFKATFDITLIVEPDLLALSNSAEISAEPVASAGNTNSKLARRFATTMKMSTYLVAFVVGPLEQTPAIDVDGVPVTVVHRPGQAHLTGFALKAAESSLRFFTEYYGIAYPGDKIDLIAIPDFAFGAMENLGCITFREVLLVVDPDTATQPELQRIADVVAHELAHMWFGDLVTMAWWEGIWLNEAFATFMEMKATDHFKPEWDRWTNFGLSRTAAFATDSLEATRPIEFAVESPADAEAMFDILTYEKGAAVVRMLEQFLGEAIFREGIRHYLAKHSYANTETSDLWDALEHVSGQNVREIMETWIYQGGYPVIAIDEAGNLHQERFSYTGAASTASWAIPVRLRDHGGTEHRVLLTNTDSSTTSPVAAADIATFNTDGSGFYRARLSAERLRSLGDNGPGDLESVERFGVLDDSWALTTAGQLEPAQYLHLLQGFSNETNVSIWQHIVGTLSTLKHLLPTERHDEFAALVAPLLRPSFAALGSTPTETDTEAERERRAQLFGALGTIVADPAIVAAARTILADKSADPALVGSAVNVVAATGSDDEFEQFLERFIGAQSPQDMQRYLYALADFPSIALAERLAQLTLTDTIRSQNGPYALLRLLHNSVAGPAVWTFVTTSWDELVEKFPSNSVARMLGGVTALSKPADVLTVRAFLADHEVPQGKKLIEQHLERLAVNAAFRARLLDAPLSTS